ncbi:hypothetical protein L1987_50815 [Smallanthus sonchifolius]|uniref:Uncharacterized protein n=1 Tax=Smallanthus sonchifolius TaxID=185202 RepID=A0ACB9ENW2_9ASTR|nr:hypothetical protein L1987_50815 [Smallanthus sonchifolius]
MTTKFGTTIVPSGAVGEDDMAELLYLFDVLKWRSSIDTTLGEAALMHMSGDGMGFHHHLFVNRKMKIEEEVAKAKKKNLETKYPLWFNFFDKFSETDLREFRLGLENKIVNVKRRKIINEFVNNLVVDPAGVHDNMIMQSSNPNYVNLIMRPVIMPSDSMVNMMLNEVDYDVVCDGGSFWAQPPLMEDCFSTEFLQQVNGLDVGRALLPTVTSACPIGTITFPSLLSLLPESSTGKILVSNITGEKFLYVGCKDELICLG